MGADHDGAGRIASPGYWWYAAAQATSIAGTTMALAAIYWLAIHLARGDALGLSALVATQFLPILIFSRRAGAIVARHQAIQVLKATQAAQAVGALAIGIPLLGGWMTVWYLCALSLAIGSVIAVDVTARQMFMLELVGKDELRRGSSLYSTITGLAKIAGPALAGVIIAAAGEAPVFVADAASFLFVLGLLIRISSHMPRGELAPARPGAARRYRWVLDLPRDIQLAALMALLIGGIGYQFEVTNPLIAADVFHLGSVGFGLLGTFMAAGGIAGSYYSSRRADPGGAEYLTWAVVFGTAEMLAAVMPLVWAYDIVMILLGAATALFATSATVFVQQQAPESQRAHAVSAYNAGFMGFVPAGAFAVAGLATAAGTRWALGIPGLTVTCCAGSVLARTQLPGWKATRQAQHHRSHTTR
jgi:MFS family permease